MENRSYEILKEIVLQEIGNTIYMVILSVLLAGITGFVIAVILRITDEKGLHPNKIIYKIVDVFVNVIRSFPFIILAVAILPFTRMIVGTSIGKEAAIVPLVLSGSCFVARLIEGNLKEVKEEVIEASKSFGASNIQILFFIIVPEAIPGIVHSITLACIAILGSSAMAGAIGAGGLGAVAISYGYQCFDDIVMYGVVITLIIIVQFIQTTGNLIYNRMKK